MKIVQIISEHKRIKTNQPLKAGYKRVEAIVEIDGFKHTKHIDLLKTK